MSLKRLLSLKRTFNNSFDNDEPQLMFMSYFAMRMNKDELPKRFYKVSTIDIDGMLLITDEQLIFVGENDDDSIMGINFLLNETKILSYKGDTLGESNIQVESEGETCVFTVSKFSISEFMKEL